MGRHRRGEYRRDDAERRSHERGWGRDEPWREETRNRYPNEPYGGEPSRYGADYRDDFGRGSHRQFTPPDGPGRGYGYGFDDSSTYRPERRPRPADSGAWNRGRTSGGYGSEYASWSAGFGFGPEERPRDRDEWSHAYGTYYGQGDLGTDRSDSGDVDDSDWVANRPARGPGRWSGDWSDAPASGGYGSPSRRQAGGPGSEWWGRAYDTRHRENYSGRAPKDYRRSDDRIREEICDRFTDDPDLDPSDVVVRVESCDVTLTGTVTSRDQKRRAEMLAEQVTGVRDVSNQLRVGAGSETSTSASGSPTASRATRGAGQQSSSVAADRER